MPTKSNSKPSKKQNRIIIGVIAFIIIAIPIIFTCFFQEYKQQKKADLELLATAEYNSIFCSMYSIENFAQADFLTYRGLNTIKLDNKLRNTSDLNEYLAAAFSSQNSIDTIYLGLDPAQIWSSSRKNTDKWNTSLQEDILSCVTAHPEVTFEVLLPAPSLAYWVQMDIDEVDEILTTYSSLVSTLAPYSNMTTYFVGNEQWLIANPSNYTDELTTNDLISQKLMLLTFCDHNFQLTAENVSAQLELLREQIVQEQTSPTVYPDLSAWDIVFFGDSIIGNYEGSFSVPGVVSGLSNANTYNCALGGTPASVRPDGILSFPSSVDYFIAQDASAIPGDGPFRASLETYLQTDHADKNLCFVINFGLNDYFSGQPVANTENPYDTTTYAGALREGISKLQTAYPDAIIVLMTPTFTSYFSNGMEPMSEKGGILTDYVEAALQVADEATVLCMNNYADLGITESTAQAYLADGCHLNEAGRFLLAKRIIEFVSNKPKN